MKESGFGQSLYKVFPNHPVITLESRPVAETQVSTQGLKVLLTMEEILGSACSDSVQGTWTSQIGERSRLRTRKTTLQGRVLSSEDKGVKSQEDGTTYCLLPHSRLYLPYKNSPLVTWGTLAIFLRTQSIRDCGLVHE